MSDDDDEWRLPVVVNRQDSDEPTRSGEWRVSRQASDASSRSGRSRAGTGEGTLRCIRMRASTHEYARTRKCVAHADETRKRTCAWLCMCMCRSASLPLSVCVCACACVRARCVNFRFFLDVDSQFQAHRTSRANRDDPDQDLRGHGARAQTRARVVVEPLATSCSERSCLSRP
jgi:hypothetical protein